MRTTIDGSTGQLLGPLTEFTPTARRLTVPGNGIEEVSVTATRIDWRVALAVGFFAGLLIGVMSPARIRL